MKTVHQQRPIELAMHVYQLTRDHASAHPDFLMAEVADIVIARFDTSRATAFRHIRAAVDVMCLDYGDTGARVAKRSERNKDGVANASALGWPKGKPGGR